MSEILKRLASCERVTEWIDPWDKRLIRATGEAPPNGGANVRAAWHLDHDAQTIVSQLVGRLLVPDSVNLRGRLKIGFDELPGYAHSRGTVVLEFSAKDDWAQCFPVGDKTQIFKTAEGLPAWAGLAVCDTLVGLAVFSCETEDDGVQARIQPVPENIFQKIIGD